MTDATRIVDVHAHLTVREVDALVAGSPAVVAQFERMATAMGPASFAVTAAMLPQLQESMTDLDVRLRTMDAAGVDVQLVSPSPMQYHYWADPGLAREVWTATNDAMAAVAGDPRGRFSAIGVAPLQHPDQAVEALEHAVVEHGLRGVEVSSFARYGDTVVQLSDPRLDSFWARAAELHALVFLHPLGCTVETSRLDAWYLDNVIGQPLEHAIALSHVIFSGVLDRHPGLRLLAAHGGGYLPTYLGRSDHAWQVRSDARTCERPPSDYARELFYDSLVYTGQGLRHLVEIAGAGQVLLGTDYPFDMGVTDPVQRLDAAGLDPADRDLVAAGNAARLGLLP
ncbi:amidohydrolase family protein [Rhodococcus opacus]|uniref:Amidohydrolase family protein n=1 Tax=Rhodococcus opacus TaxID=37919 RepID=A0AAX3YV23_RHOOP|nr:amidohydrolase family protein [Rhodococcus opacus]MCZ4585972.1 amidohydrolase family protein [Rhodococcus opacus]WLF52072.1 amidohydrolase family protein [Rhodococcus opacus]